MWRGMLFFSIAGDVIKQDRSLLRVALSSQTMDMMTMLEQLRGDRERIQEVIAVLERVADGRGGKRRGRPPAWVAEIKRRGRPPGSKNKKGRIEP
jgi:hypothetical protein